MFFMYSQYKSSVRYMIYKYFFLFFGLFFTFLMSVGEFSYFSYSCFLKTSVFKIVSMLSAEWMDHKSDSLDVHMENKVTASSFL